MSSANLGFFKTCALYSFNYDCSCCHKKGSLIWSEG